MDKLKFLVVGKNQDILLTLQRLIEANNWEVVIKDDEQDCYAFLKQQQVDVILLSSGLTEVFEQEIRIFVQQLNPAIKIIDHYGGGSGLLKNEVYSLFPEMAPPTNGQ